MTTRATVTSVTTSPASGVEHVGDTVTFTISFDSAITVRGGTPTLTLNDGGLAVYDAAASAALGDPTKLVFTYTVATSDQSVSGLSFVRGDQNGAVIFDNATGQGPDFTNLFAASFPGIQVVAPPTAAISVVTSPASGVEHVGDTVTFTIAFNNAITITGGTPTLTLSNGGTATYDAAATAAQGDPTKLVFAYAVGAGDTFVAGLSFVRGDQNGSVIVDPSGLGPDFTKIFTSRFPDLQVSQPGPGGLEIAVATATSGPQTGPLITTLANGSFVVAWTDLSLGVGGATGDSSSFAIKAQVFATDGSKIGSEMLVNTATSDSQFLQQPTALKNGRFVVTWTDYSQGIGGTGGDTSSTAIKAQMFAADGTRIGSEILVNTATAGSQGNPDITALSNGGFVVTWDDSSQGIGGAGGDTSSSAVKAQVFDSNGSKIGVEFLVNTATSGTQSITDITSLSNGGFVVTWTDFSQGVGGAGGDTSLVAVKVQVFAADGTRIGTEILANTATDGQQAASTATALANGGFVVTWRTLVFSPTVTFGFSLQVFAADGSKIGSEIVGSDPLAGLTRSVVALANGGFVMTWDHSGSGIGNAAIRAQLFAADGTKIDAEISVNSTTSSFQMSPQITALSDGGFVVTWWEDGTVGSGDRSDGAVKAQIFAGDGTKIGAEILVNVNTPYDQYAPQITALPDGRFAITWTDSGPGPLGEGLATFTDDVRARVFDPSPNVTVIAQGTTLDIATGSAARVAFADGGAVLQLDHATAFIGQINGFGDGDTIDLGDVAFSTGTTLGYKANSGNSGGTLTVSDGSHTAALALLGQYSAASFAIAGDGHGGTVISSATEAAQANTLAAPHA